MWNPFNSKKKRKVASLGYVHQGTLLVLNIQENGDVRVTIDTRGFGSTTPMQKAALVHVTLDRDALPIIKQWFANISGAYTEVDTDVQAIELPPRK